MLVYFVIGDSSELKAKVETKYPEHNEAFTGGWVIGTTNETTADVAESLGMNGTDAVTGIVIQPGSYNGYYNSSLWERINLWKEQVA